MKTKNLTPREALELILLTGKHIKTINGWVFAVDIDGINPFFVMVDGVKFWSDTAEIEIPEGRNPDELTIAHLQMGENGHEYRLLEEGEEADELTIDIEIWDEKSQSWKPGYYGCLADETYRTRKPNGYFLPKQEVQS